MGPSEYELAMGPSEYELEAWEAVQRFKGRPLSQGMRSAGGKAADGFAALGDNADKFLENHPKAELAVSRGKEVAVKGAKAISTGFHKAAGALPDWSGEAIEATKRSLTRISRAGLSPRRVVGRHQKRGH